MPCVQEQASLKRTPPSYGTLSATEPSPAFSTPPPQVLMSEEGHDSLAGSILGNEFTCLAATP